MNRLMNEIVCRRLEWEIRLSRVHMQELYCSRHFEKLNARLHTNVLTRSEVESDCEVLDFDGLIVALDVIRMTMKAARQCAKDWIEWRSIVRK